MRKMMQNAEKNFQNFQNKAQQKQSEPVQNNFQSTKVKKQVGEYIEYEEIKD